MNENSHTMSERPHLRVVHGNPTDEEVAALVAVITTLNTRDTPAPPPPRSAWSDRRTLHRPPLPHGPNAWHTSTFPH
ncbi:acyl-CoA carboxylase subunit epsilon [Actinophytocola glycyrrhizae]|uniref:Acyl-CoA carboxylase subunit epsilon n=1 Tax=Actinophytocola glycyrrhizae TaxID=2044873 RepID=A0ABV9RZ18_9PSEU